jgi:Heme exporter protein D (CcmD)
VNAWIASQGHDFYLLGSYLVCAAAMLIEPLRLLQRHRRARAEAARPLDDES